MKKTLAVFMAVPLISSWLVGSVSAQQNLVVNGSFEWGPPGKDEFPGWPWFGAADNNSDYGVAQSSVSPDVAEDGQYYAYFHGAPTDGSQDCLGQSVNLIVGAQYNITYYLGTDGTTLGSGAGMWVQIGNDFGLSANDVMLTAFLPNSSNAIPYQEFSTNYTATLPNPILSFHGVDPTSSILLDNVSMTLVLPQLNVSLTPSNTLTFAWTAWTNGFRLQATPTLDATNWVTLTNVPSTNGSSNLIVLPTPPGNSYYRLTLP